jgi:hypothetical protein
VRFFSGFLASNRAADVKEVKGNTVSKKGSTNTTNEK